jgi:hypothetical protein
MEREKEILEDHPFFGNKKILMERIHSLDDKWYIEFWENHYFFLGIEIYTSMSEVVRKNNHIGNSEEKNSSKIQ